MKWNLEQCKMWRDWAIEAYAISKEEQLELWKLCAIQAKRSGDTKAYETAQARIKALESEAAAQ